MKKINICVYPAQNESAVEINNALAYCVEINVYGVACVRGHNEYNFKNYYYGMPSIDEENFTEEFEKFLVSHSIDVVFPTNDSAVVFFAENKDKFSAKIANGDMQSAKICNNKKKTYELFKDCDFCPEIFSEITKFPCFIKPVEGEGAIGARCINTESDVQKNINLEDYVILEFLPGKELTVDCVTDRKGNLKAILPRERTRVFSGMCVVGDTIPLSEEIKNIAEIINDRLKLSGLWYFQVRQDTEGKYKLLEISMRCAGTMCQTRARGYNLPLLSVYTALGKDINTINNNFKVRIDRTLFARFKTDLNFSTVYVDYDGTIVINDMVCLSLIRFLYQCKNEKKRIVMVTRHDEDHDNTVREDMEKYGLAESLFDEIHSISVKESKCDSIKDKEAIFIDNSYFERLEVHEKIGIPVFSVEGIDVLQDWRI